MKVSIAQALFDARQRLSDVSDAPHIEARYLLGHVLQKTSAWLLGHDRDVLEEAVVVQFEELLAKRATGQPLAYVLGSWQFFDAEFRVNRHVLIPRPETEQLVALAADWLRNQSMHRPVIVDVGTGSGAIAISLARLFPGAIVYATDISPDALAVARDNATRLDAEHVHFVEGHLLDAVPDAVCADLLVANLPYIAPDELDTLDVVRWEPRLALDGGEDDGLALIRALLQQAPHRLQPHASILLEIGADQGPYFAHLPSHYQNLMVYQDLAKRDRIVRFQLQEPEHVDHSAC